MAAPPPWAGQNAGASTVDAIYRLTNSLHLCLERANDILASRLVPSIAALGPSMLDKALSSSTSNRDGPLPLPAPMSHTNSNASIPPTPSMIRPQLPPEVIDNILGFAALKDLATSVVLVNSFFNPIASRRLYAILDLSRLSNRRIIKCLLTLTTLNPRLATHVRQLVLCPPPSFEPTMGFYRLVQKALNSVVGLVSLSLEFPRTHDAPGWILEGCKFQLRELVTAMPFDGYLGAFLEGQRGIVELTLRGLYMERSGANGGGIMGSSHLTAMFPMTLPLLPLAGATTNNNANADADRKAKLRNVFTLSKKALPKLKIFNTVHAGPIITRMVVENRPVESASIPLFHSSSFESLDALTSSGKPLRKLSVISFDSDAPGFLFQALGERFPMLEALHMVMLMASCSKSLLESAGVHLKNFKALKYITFMAMPGEDARSISEKEIAKQWHEACPTLKTIILPEGRLWIHGDSSNDVQPLTASPSAASTSSSSSSSWSISATQGGSAPAGTEVGDWTPAVLGNGGASGGAEMDEDED